MTATPPVPTSALRWRGIVEGFYGPPWTTDQRRDQLRFAAGCGMNLYLLAPKDDPFHRARWREPYPAPAATDLGQLAAEAAALGIRFVVGIAPGLDWSPGDERALIGKVTALRRAGVEHVALLFDDLPGRDPAAGADLGRRHGRLAAVVAGDPLLVCPSDYAGVAPTPYRGGLAETLPDDALVLWSGPEVVSGRVSAEDVERASAAFGRRLVLWDNVPVNDFDRARTYAGPLRGRPARSELAGLLANPMIEAAAARITLATAAEYALDPAGYDPQAALGRSLAAAGEAARIAPLAAACGWPPDADTGSELRPLVTAALAGDPGPLRAALAPLAQAPDGPPRGPVATELEPWRRAGHDLAGAALTACDGLAGARIDPAALRAQLAVAEAHWPNVLRDVLSPFVRTVLGTVLGTVLDDPESPYALIVASGEPTAGEERLAELLRRRGLACRRRLDPDEPPALVVVSRSADERAAREASRLPVPLVGLFHLVPLGLATTSGVLLREQRVVIAAPGHPLAGGRTGFTGTVPVYRGPAMARWGEPGPDATVVARAEEEPHPVLVHYPAGATLADGTTAPAARAALFLGRDLLAPWMMTADGVALVDAALGALLAGSRSGTYGRIGY